jgi:hypothetical protein
MAILYTGSLQILNGVGVATSSELTNTGSVYYPGWDRVTALSDSLVTISGAWIGSATIPMAKGDTFDCLYKAQGTTETAAGFTGTVGLITSVRVLNSGSVLLQKAVQYS